MKKMVTFLKLGFVALTLTVIFGLNNSSNTVFAQKDKVCSATPCQPGYIYGCYDCSNGNCNGCYRQNGDQGCGVCHTGGGGFEELEQVSTSWLPNF